MLVIISWKLFEIDSAKHLFVISDFWKIEKLDHQTYLKNLGKLKVKAENWKWKVVFQNDTKRT